MKRIAFLLFLPLFLAACDGTGPETDANLNATATEASVRGGQTKVGVCHRTLSTTNPWVLITIAEPAVQHHLDNHLNRAGNPVDYRADDPTSPLDENCVVRPPTPGNGRIIIELISEAAFLNQSELWLFAPGANPGPDQTPLDGTNGRYIFRNDFAYGVASNAPNANGATSHTGPMYIIEGSTLPTDTPLHFGLFVNNLYNPGFTNPLAISEGVSTRGAWFYTSLVPGDGSNNFDNEVHAQFLPVPSPPSGTTVYELGFEDLCMTAPGVPAVCANTLDFADFDYNDIVFRVTIED